MTEADRPTFLCHTLCQQIEANLIKGNINNKIKVKIIDAFTQNRKRSSKNKWFITENKYYQTIKMATYNYAPCGKK